MHILHVDGTVIHVCFNTDFTCVFQHRHFELCMYTPRSRSGSRSAKKLGLVL